MPSQDHVRKHRRLRATLGAFAVATLLASSASCTGTDTASAPSELDADTDTVVEDSPGDAEGQLQSTAELTVTGDLDTFLDELTSQHSGDIAISVKEIGGESREGSSHGSEAFRVASTYKVYVAYTLLQQLESGEIGWEDPVVDDRNVSECLDAMLMLSDNPCAETLAEDLEWDTIYADAASTGAVDTHDGEGSMQTTANDLTQFLTSMETGELNLDEQSLQRLEDGLAGNEYREGIPAGSSGTVLDKPGFIDDLLHDAAIVRHAEGTYVITVMTENSSWENIAEITSEVEAELYS